MAELIEKEGTDVAYADTLLPPMQVKSSKICQYFAGTSIFVTGATGFLGKLIVEKFLRTCTDVENVFILVREKKGKTVEKRLEELLENIFFDTIKREQPKFAEKIKLVVGDCYRPNLGLSDKDRQMLIENVHCVFHCAATVRFDEKIRTATYINVRATRDILALSKEMKRLKSFIYVSTAFSNCVRKDIHEEFYNCTITGEKLLTLVDTLDDDFLYKITPTLIGEWPNTYVFTKAVAEEVVKSEGRGLPVAIVRPSIVVSTAKEPIAGWIDNMYGATGVTVGAALGLIRTLQCNLDALADLVPADFVTNCTIAAAWHIGTLNLNVNNEIRYEPIPPSTEDEENKIPIYNYVGSPQKPITWRRFMKYAEFHLKQVPSHLQVWHYFFILNSNYYLHVFCKFLFHVIPAYLIDFLALCVGKQPLLVKGYLKIDKFLNVIAYFSTRQWNFSNKNTLNLWNMLTEEDRKTFDFDMGALNWNSYFHTYARGGRVYLLKDSLETLPEGRVKYLKLQVAHYILVVLILLGLLKVLMILFSFIF